VVLRESNRDEISGLLVDGAQHGAAVAGGGYPNAVAVQQQSDGACAGLGGVDAVGTSQ